MPKRSPRLTVSLCILLVPITSFSATNGSGAPAALAAWNNPDSFIDAVAKCESRGASLAELTHIQGRWPGLLGTGPSSQTEGGAAPFGGGLWTWDESRLCRAALLTTVASGSSASASPPPIPVLVSLEGRPCAQRLPYVCVPDVDVRAAGLTPSSDWFRTHVQTAGTSVGTTANATAATAGLVVGSSSPHLLGPERSGLVLLRSGYALGGTRVALGLKADEWGSSMMNNTSSLYSQLRTVAFDDSGLFWSRGPVVSAFFRSHNGRLLALRPVREAEVVEVAAAAASDTATVGNTNTTAGLLSDGGVFGASRPDLDGIIAPYETHHVGPYNDYVVSVQGCFRTLAVEALVLITRSGRRYRLGRGSCSVWFREDAPPGGYLAGFAGLHIDVEYWSSQPPLPSPEGQLPNAPWLMQAELVWAAPAGSPPPTYTQRLPALLRHSTAQIAPPSSACPGAYPLASLNEELMPFCTWPWREQWPVYYFAPHLAAGCPSNMCCNKPLFMPYQDVYIPYNYSAPTCSTDTMACTRSCQIQAGLCGVVPDRPALQFAATFTDTVKATAVDVMAATAATAPARQQQQQSYIVYPDTHVTHEAAADICRSSTHMGLAWRLVTAREILGWTSALDIRNPAYGTLMAIGYFWLGDSGGGGATCMTALYSSAICSAGGSGDGTAECDRVTYSTTIPCDGVAAVVCALATPFDSSCSGNSSNSAGTCSSSSSLVQTGGNASRAWTPGPHRLSLSRHAFASGNFGNITCTATLLENTSSSSSSSTAQQQPALASNLTVTLEAPPRAFLVSTAIQASELGNSVSAVSGLGVELGGDAAADGPAAADRAILTAGNPSTRGWHRLELLPGEVVVAASGCAGGHLELLLLHTSSGRVLAPPLTAGPEGAAGGSAACTSSFVEAAPAGSYLVGFQVTFGQFIESMRLLWGQPLATPGAAAASGGSTGSSSTGGPAGNEGRGGALDSAVGSGLHTEELSTAGPQQPVAAAGDQSSSNRNGSSSTPQSGGVDGGAVRPGVIGGTAAGAAVLVVAVVAVAALVVLLRRRRQRWHQRQSPDGKLDAVLPVGGSNISSPGTTSVSCSGGRAAAMAGSSGDSQPGGATAGAQDHGSLAMPSSSPLASTADVEATECEGLLLPQQPLAGDEVAGVAAVTLWLAIDDEHERAVATQMAGGAAAGSGQQLQAAAGSSSSASGGVGPPALRVRQGCVAPAVPLHRRAGSATLDVDGQQQRDATGGSCDALTAGTAAAVPAARADLSRRVGAIAAAPDFARVATSGVSVSTNPQQPLLSQRQLAPAEATGHDPGRRGASGHSGPGSSSSTMVSSASPSSNFQLPSAARVSASSGLSPAAYGSAETARTDGVPSPNPRWERLPTAGTQSSCNDASPRAASGHLECSPVAPLPGLHTQGRSVKSGNDEEFRSRLCAYISSCHVSDSVADWCSAVHADGHAAVAGQEQDHDVYEGWQEAAPGSMNGTADSSPQQSIEEALVTAQAELAKRQRTQHSGQPGQRRRDLLLTSVLGSGSFGVVFNGTWRGLRVAVKTLVVQDSLLGAERHRAILEAAISKSLNHLNVVNTYETKVIPLSVPAAARKRPARPDAAAGLGQGAAGVNGCATTTGNPAARDTPEAAVLDSTTDTYKLMLIMEYCDAGSLARALDDHAVGSVAAGGVPAMCALTLALDVACGMRHIHARNIVHGDLSAGNILLCSTADQCHGGDPADAPLRSALGGLLWAPPLVAKVADFGLSVHMGEHQTHASNRFQGTPAYTAPEVLSRGRLSAAADVWSFGCILLELTYGERMGRIRARAAAQVAAANTTSAAGGKVVAVPWCVPPPGSSPRLVQLLASCLSVDPSARPSFDQVAEALVAILVETHHNTQQSVLATLVMKGDAPQQQQQHS